MKYSIQDLVLYRILIYLCHYNVRFYLVGKAFIYYVAVISESALYPYPALRFTQKC